jgi:hypothetical protein
MGRQDTVLVLSLCAGLQDGIRRLGICRFFHFFLPWWWCCGGVVDQAADNHVVDGKREEAAPPVLTLMTVFSLLIFLYTSLTLQLPDRYTLTGAVTSFSSSLYHTFNGRPLRKEGKEKQHQICRGYLPSFFPRVAKTTTSCLLWFIYQPNVSS